MYSLKAICAAPLRWVRVINDAGVGASCALRPGDSRLPAGRTPLHSTTAPWSGMSEVRALIAANEKVGIHPNE